MSTMNSYDECQQNRMSVEFVIVVCFLSREGGRRTEGGGISRTGSVFNNYTYLHRSTYNTCHCVNLPH